MSRKHQRTVLVLTGHGLNCQVETLDAFEGAGHRGRIVHIDDLFGSPRMLDEADVLAFVGGFSFGDQLGAGKALGNLMQQHLARPFADFMARGDTLAIGICNGCQALVKSGLWHQDPQTAASISIAGNRDGHYICRWEGVRTTPGAARGPWLSSVQECALPIAHGEGRFVGDVAPHAALVYSAQDSPNGSVGHVAGVQGYGGRLLALMPHPERATKFHHQPHWTRQREILRRNGQEIPTAGPGQGFFV